MSVVDANEATILCADADLDRAPEQAARRATARADDPSLDDPLSPDSLPLLANYFRRGAKPLGELTCGIEFELFGYDSRRHLARIDAAQVQAVLSDFATAHVDLIYEGETLIEADAGRRGRVTVEPGGQIEFSGAPYRTLHEVERATQDYLAHLREIAARQHLIFLAAGFDPLRTLAEQHWFPKQRYEVMRPFLAARGRRAWDMMCRTCATQINLDYASESDLAQKFTLGNRLAPIITAIFANSPFADGQPSGYKSTRAAAWLATDPARTGVAPPTLADDFSLDTFVDYALDVPLIFVRHEGRYLEAMSGATFREFLTHPSRERQPVLGDWSDHLTTIFTDARLKQYVELRSADCGTLALALALAALWKGLLYDADALDEALRVAPKLSEEDARVLREAVARDGLAARGAGVNVKIVAKETVRLAVEGLRRIAPDELKFLDVLREQVIEDEVCPADVLLRNWHGSWHGSMSRVVEYLRIV